MKYSGLVLLGFLLGGQYISAQTIVEGRIIDGLTREPIQGATIHCNDEGCVCGCVTDNNGVFQLECHGCKKLSVTSVGYSTKAIAAITGDYLVSLEPVQSLLQKVVISATRNEGVQRSKAPIAIAAITFQNLQETKPVTADEVINKISGVNMVNLGNEQHEMSIRQPMTTKSLFLYLEDGIPIRTTGLYNHNALLEMNMAATKSIEVIKGPSSSLYGSEAIGGVVNFITLSPTAVPLLKLSMQGNQIGYKRADLQSSYSKGKWGFVLSGYYAGKRNGYIEYSDYHKGIVTARLDYKLSGKTSLSNSLTWLDYFSDMPGGIDSAMFASRSFKNQQTFTYRKVKGIRYRSTLTQVWNENSKSTVSLLYKQNAIGQNPSYRVKDDYHRQGNVFTGDKELAHGEINEISFNSYSFIAQHKQNIPWKQAVLIGGVNADISPSAYQAAYIRIKKDTINNKYTGYQNTDSMLAHYATRLDNFAAFAHFSFSPAEKWTVVTSLRYDLFHYGFDNYLVPSSFSGSPDTANHFARLSPKIGFTYNFNSRTGLYANYSEGFVPPQVTEMYTGVKVPNLDPAVFYNYEVGGWMEVIKNKLSADFSIYRLDGANEIISVRQDDGSYSNQNAGKTTHRGVELSILAKLLKNTSFRFSGTYSRHKFVEYLERGIKYDNNEMNNAPHWVYNTEAWYRPLFLKGFRIGAEWQHVGRYFTDPQNTSTYKGYNALNLRTGYAFGAMEIWLNVMNATGNYYSYITTKSSFGYSYQLAEPRNFNMGVSYDFGRLFKKGRP